MIHVSDGNIDADSLRAHADLSESRSHVDERSSESDNISRTEAIERLAAAAQQFADKVAARPNHGDTGAPLEDLSRMAALGMMTAPLPVALGGLGLGTESHGHLPLLRLLATIGGADLVLGRLYEGHVNALILIATYGTQQQMARSARDAANGLLFGVWNTGGAEPLRLTESEGGYTYLGEKTFASGASFIDRPIVTAEWQGRGWQMTLPRMESPEVAGAVILDQSSWNPLGMKDSQSYGIGFTGAIIVHEDLIGEPEDFYKEPMFRGGAIRFAAVHTGAVLRLHRMFAEWLETKGRGNDPYQVARIGQISLYAQEAVLWIERAALEAEKGLSPTADKLSRERVTEFADMTRLAIEQAATAAVQCVVAGIGAHGLLRPSNFERIVRNLTMYLRQPAPDHTLAEVGRAALRKNGLRADGATSGMWCEKKLQGSLPPLYFQTIYENSRDPWNFEGSEYEKDKYRETLTSLPQARYSSALEVGCSIGVLTEQLAVRCNSLLSVDVSELALTTARERCAWLPHVKFECVQIPRQMPEGVFDLVVVSEIGYYLQRDDLERTVSLLAERQPAGGHLILVHFTELVPDYPLTGDEVHDLWLARSEWRPIVQRRYARYRLDVLERLA